MYKVLCDESFFTGKFCLANQDAVIKERKWLAVTFAAVHRFGCSCCVSFQLEASGLCNPETLKGMSACQKGLSDMSFPGSPFTL